MDNKKKVFLHIGHGKTGTTAFQCFMSQNYLNLIENKILYNKSELTEFNLALKNKINSGNINPNNDWVRDSLLPVLESKINYRSYIFSNENLFHNINPFINFMRNINQIKEYTNEQTKKISVHYKQAYLTINNQGFIEKRSKVKGTN